jgi:hypothetical protein
MTTTITFEEAVGRIIAAGDFQELTGMTADGPAYRRWAKVVHPDAVSAARRATATDAFAKLSALYKASGAKTLRGYRMGRVFAEGDVAQLFVDGSALVKVPRQPADNDLMEAEATALRTLLLYFDMKISPAQNLFCEYIGRRMDSQNPSRRFFQERISAVRVRESAGACTSAHTAPMKLGAGTFRPCSQACQVDRFGDVPSSPTTKAAASSIVSARSRPRFRPAASRKAVNSGNRSPMV